jgi:hypothetical protein
LNHTYTLDDFSEDKGLLHAFGQLDDYDVWGAVKLWQSNRDPILSRLCTMMLNRNLFRIRLSTEPIQKSDIERVRLAIHKEWKIMKGDAMYLFSHGTVSNEAYLLERHSIQVLMKSGALLDVAQATDLPNIKAMSKIVKKNYLCWPKSLSLP